MSKTYEKIAMGLRRAIAIVRGRRCWRCGGTTDLRPRINGAPQPGLECRDCREAYIKWKYADMHMTEMMFRDDAD